MIDLKAMRERAAEGLVIAEKATDGPFVLQRESSNHWALAEVLRDSGNKPPIVIYARAEAVDDGPPAILDAAFFADARTRAPDAYRDVIALCEEVERLKKQLAAKQWALDVARDAWKAFGPEESATMVKVDPSSIKIVGDDQENCGAQHYFAEWPEAPPCTIGKGHAGPHENGCFQWGMSQGPLRQDPRDE